jgi:hypothetical protein
MDQYVVDKVAEGLREDGWYRDEETGAVYYEETRKMDQKSIDKFLAASKRRQAKDSGSE